MCRPSAFCAHLAAVIGLLLFAPHDSSAQAVVRIETLANAEMVFPGGVELYGFRYPVINDAGDVAFESTGVEQGYGVWRLSAGGTLSLFLQTYIVPPEAADGATLDLVDGIMIPEAGDRLVVTSELSDGHYGVFALNSNAEIWTVALEGNSAPGTGGTFDRIHPSMRMSDAGQVAFHADLDMQSGATTVSNSRGIWFGDAGSLDLLARRDIETGLGGESYALTVGEYPRVTPDGTVVFATTRIDILGSESDVWTGGLAGQSAALSTSDGSFNYAVIAENGKLGVVEAMGAEQSAYRLRAGDPGDMRTVITSSDPAPGGGGRTIAGALGTSVGYQLRVNRSGKLAFAAALSCDTQVEPLDACRPGIWSEGAGALELVALVGDPAPGDAGYYEDFLGLEFNDLGQVAFLAETTEGGDALYLANPGEEPRLVVRDGVGATFEYAPGDERLVLSFRSTLEWADFLSPSHHGGLNDAGELAFSVEVDGYGSGLYKATLPEPTAGVSALVVLATLSLLRARETRPAPRRMRALPGS